MKTRHTRLLLPLSLPTPTLPPSSLLYLTKQDKWLGKSNTLQLAHFRTLTAGMHAYVCVWVSFKKMKLIRPLYFEVKGVLYPLSTGYCSVTVSQCRGTGRNPSQKWRTLKIKRRHWATRTHSSSATTEGERRFLNFLKFATDKLKKVLYFWATRPAKW